MGRCVPWDVLSWDVMSVHQYSSSSKDVQPRLVKDCKGNCRVVDPDPHGSALIFPPGSRRVNLSTKNLKNARKLQFYEVI